LKKRRDFISTDQRRKSTSIDWQESGVSNVGTSTPEGLESYSPTTGLKYLHTDASIGEYSRTPQGALLAKERLTDNASRSFLDNVYLGEQWSSEAMEGAN